MDTAGVQGGAHAQQDRPEGEVGQAQKTHDETAGELPVDEDEDAHCKEQQPETPAQDHGEDVVRGGGGADDERLLRDRNRIALQRQTVVDVGVGGGSGVGEGGGRRVAVTGALVRKGLLRHVRHGRVLSV